MRPTLVIMVKVPRPGRVKTRLGRDIGMTAAAWWFRHQVRRLLRRIEDPRWDTVLAVAPDAEGLQSRVWPARFTRWAQGRGSLGDRMIRMMRQAGGPVCVIGADIPGVTRQRVAEAFAALGRHDAVFGPAPDGGYWLIGVKTGSKLGKNALDGVRWSTEHALADSRVAMDLPRVAFVQTLADVDTAYDLP
ncbi:TIGR04282 family arsenosugar biosynthesis glycosyltransferase [uncultured Tateyamaria sp.]|uniref:TIGR04282 family arsenosugar biosynthesis glycosyltransferase n=1 Tax=uncultured Tateyamaria sp. TaxID=455651 RepID=UPI0026063E70|nr:TIGR04282 family arsenosugar biosynthesis glycosyltransferase [uncultured Tateyamaria sp.]